MEQRWFVWGFLVEEVDRPWGDWSRHEPWAERGPWPAAPGPAAVPEKALRSLGRHGRHLYARLAERNRRGMS
jgi:hypothetical protein